MGQRFGQDKKFTLVNGMEIVWRATDIWFGKMAQNMKDSSRTTKEMVLASLHLKVEKTNTAAGMTKVSNTATVSILKSKEKNPESFMAIGRKARSSNG